MGKREQRDTCWVTALCLVGLLLRLPGMYDDLWYDELTATRIWLTQPALILTRTLWDTHPHFYSLLMYVWTWGGTFDAAWWIRCPSLIAGTLLIYQIYCFCVPRFGTATARWASALAVCSPPAIWYSHEAKQYALIASLFLLLLTMFERLAVHRRVSYLCIFTVVGIAFVLSHFYCAFVLPVYCLYALFCSHGKARMWQVVGVGMVTIAFCAYLVMRFMYGDMPLRSNQLRTFTVIEWALWLGNWMPVGSVFGSSFSSVGTWFSVCLYGAALLFGIGNLRRFQSERILYFGLLSTPPVILLLFSMQGLGSIYIERSLYFLAPIYFVLLGHGCARLWRHWPRRSLGVFASVHAVALLLYFHSDGAAIFYPKPAWEAVADRLLHEQNLQEGSAVPLFAPRASWVLRYYSDNICLAERGKEYYAYRTFFALSDLTTGWMAFARNELVQQIDKRIEGYHQCRKSAVIEVYHGNVMQLLEDEALFEDELREFYVIEHAHWEWPYGAQRELLDASPRFRRICKEKFAGLTVYKYTLIALATN